MEVLERCTRWVDGGGVWFREQPDAVRIAVAGLAFPTVAAWWCAYEWRRGRFGPPVADSDERPSADLARRVWVTEKLGLLPGARSEHKE
jgi:hypothetical protein